MLIIICLGGEGGGKDGSANYYFLGRKGRGNEGSANIFFLDSGKG